MISILLHRQNLNLVIFGWTELLILKDFVIWCKNRCWHWHEQISLVHMPLVSHHHQSVTQTVRSSQQRSLLLRGSRSWSLNQGKLTLRSIEPLLGRANESTHISGTQGSSNIRQIGFSCYFHYYSYGAAFLLIDWIPLTINNPAVLVLLLLSGI